MMLFKISSLVAASTGLFLKWQDVLELKSIVGFAGSAEVGV